jgi:arginyl-tRNA synthetase
MQNKSFDLEESVSFDGNSGPYLQYTYARIQSVLSNAPKSVNGSQDIDQDILTLLGSEEELNLIKWLERFPETVSLAAEELSPHYISTFLFELAQRFNIFYKQHSINSAESGDLITARRFLAKQTAQVLKNGLNLLGIEVVDKM